MCFHDNLESCCLMRRIHQMIQNIDNNLVHLHSNLMLQILILLLRIFSFFYFLYFGPQQEYYKYTHYLYFHNKLQQ